MRIRYSGTRFTLLSALSFLKTDTRRAKILGPINKQIDGRRKFLLPYELYLLKFPNDGIIYLSSSEGAAVCASQLRKKNVFLHIWHCAHIIRLFYVYTIRPPFNTCGPDAINGPAVGAARPHHFVHMDENRRRAQKKKKMTKTKKRNRRQADGQNKKTKPPTRGGPK